MGEWYVVLNLILCGIALLVCSMASKRFALAAVVLSLNYGVNIAAVLHGYSLSDLRIIAGASDLVLMVALFWTIRAYPTSTGLHLAAFAVLASLSAHWAFHTSTGFTATSNIGFYYAVTNGAIAVVALGLIWSAAIRAGARRGVVGILPDPFGFDGSRRVPVGAAKKARAS